MTFSIYYDKIIKGDFMYIYDRHLNIIDLYLVENKEQEIIKYKKEILNQYKEYFYSLRTTSRKTIKDFSDLEQISLDKIIYEKGFFLGNMDWSSIFKPKFLSDQEKEEQEKILDNYFNGLYDNKHLTDVTNGIKHYYFLKTEEAKTIISYKDLQVFEIDNMINLPKELFDLSLFQNGLFEELLLNNPNLDPNLFTLVYKKRINLNEIVELYKSGLINGSLEETISKINASSMILRKIKKEK